MGKLVPIGNEKLKKKKPILIKDLIESINEMEDVLEDIVESLETSKANKKAISNEEKDTHR